MNLPDLPRPKPMEWRGRELQTTQDFIDAMTAMWNRSDVDQARQFLNAYRKVSADALAELGYLTGYMEADKGKHVRAFFGIEHPVFAGLDPARLRMDEMLFLGAATYEQVLSGKPFAEAGEYARDQLLKRQKARDN